MKTTVMNPRVKGVNYKLALLKHVQIMGILNVTPDSFSDAGVYFSKDVAIEHAIAMENEGADIIDIGAESARPGSDTVSDTEQLRRIEDIVKTLAKKLKIPISIDTSSSEVAKRCLDLGASIINDISALRKDPELGSVIAEHNAGVVLMHMKGTPRTMQQNPQYEDLISEIIDFLRKAQAKAISYGIKEDNIIIDPGIGFGKTTEHNLNILKFLSSFKILGSSILIGTSRKSFIGNVLGLPVSERDIGTAASCVIAILNGAKILRVHDVKQIKQVVALTEAINN